MVNFEINSTFYWFDLLWDNVYKSCPLKKTGILNAAFFLCDLEGCEILDNLSKFLWFGTSGCTTLTSVFHSPHFSPSEIESFHSRQIGDSCFLVKYSLITLVNFMEISSLPDKFKYWPCLVKYFLSKPVSNIFMLL